MLRAIVLSRPIITVLFAFFLMLTCAVAGPPPANWLQVNQDGFVPGLGPGSEGTALFVFDEKLYALNNAGLFRMDSLITRAWTKVIPPSPPSGPGPAPALTPLGDYLYAWNANELWWIKKGADPSGSHWTKVSSAGLPGNVSPVPRVVFNGKMYGVYNETSSGTFEIWRSPNIGSATANWERVVANSFNDPANSKGIDVMIRFNGRLYAGTTTLGGIFGDPRSYGTGVGVWESITGDSGTWSKVNTDGFGTLYPGCLNGVCDFAIHQVIGSAAVYRAPGQTRDYLYIGTKSHFGAEIWRYDGTGINGWVNVTPPWAGPCQIGCGPGRNEDMAVFGESLYVAEGFPTANLSRYDGTNWSIVVDGPYPFDPGNTRLASLAVRKGKLYVSAGWPAGTRGDQVWGFPVFLKQVPLDNWTPVQPGQSTWLMGATYGNGTFVVVGASGNVYISPDGTGWTMHSANTFEWLTDVTYGKGTFVIVGYSGVTFTSPNGTGWTPQSSGTTDWLGGVTFGNNTFVAVGMNGTIRTSPNGISWAPQISGTPNTLNRVAYGNGSFVAVGQGGIIRTSPNGTGWGPGTSLTLNDLLGVAYGKGTFVAVGNGGTILTSPNGAEWTPQQTDYATYSFTTVTYGNGLFIAAGYDYSQNNALVISSTDGVSWTKRYSDGNIVIPGSVPAGAASGKGVFIVAGSGGEILRSDPLVTGKIGVFRNAFWYLDYNGNGLWSGCGADSCYSFGIPTDAPVVGDWNGDGRKKIGVKRGAEWYLDYNGNGVWDGCGTTPAKDRCFSFGLATDKPVSGDWNFSGSDKIGVFRSGKWYLDFDGNGMWDGCLVDLCASFGLPTDIPVTGDWNGDGYAEVGVFRNGAWHLDSDGSNFWSDCSMDRCYSYGLTGDAPVVGDWGGSGVSGVGVRRGAAWYLDFSNEGKWSGCGTAPDKDMCYNFGFATDKPVTGNW